MDYNSHNGQHLHRHHHYHHSRNQSFSSALLDAIYKSTEVEGGIMAYKISNRQEMKNVEAMKNTVMRSSIIERQWDEDSWKNDEKLMRGRAAKVGAFNGEKTEDETSYIKHRESHRSFQSSCDDRTFKWVIGGECSRDLDTKSSVREGNFRPKEKPFSPADHPAKIKLDSKTGNYSKKPSQPISPGWKLVNFINSLFMAVGTKKPKFSSSSSVSDSNSCNSYERKPASVNSSSSSVQSGPRLSKISRGPNNTSAMTQKSLTFYPTNVIVDKGDSRPCGEKCLHRVENPAPNPIFWCYPHTHPSKGAYKLRLPEKQNHEATVAAKRIIGKYQTANGIMAAFVRTLDKQEEEEEEDAASCSSSDLFELENLADVNMNIYQKELRV